MIKNFKLEQSSLMLLAIILDLQLHVATCTELTRHETGTLIFLCQYEINLSWKELAL